MNKRERERERERERLFVSYIYKNTVHMQSTNGKKEYETGSQKRP